MLSRIFGLGEESNGMKGVGVLGNRMKRTGGGLELDSWSALEGLKLLTPFRNEMFERGSRAVLRQTIVN